MTRIPQPGNGAEGFDLVYDAWNRLVEVGRDDGQGGTQTVAEYEYTGDNRRVVKHNYAVGQLDASRHVMLQPLLTWAEDGALLRSNPSADPGAKTEGRAVRHYAAARPSTLRDWHQSDKPSRPDAATKPSTMLTHHTLTPNRPDSSSR